MCIAPCDRNFELPFSDKEAISKLGELFEAFDCGDEERAMRIARQFPLAPSVARAVKNAMGAEFLRRSGFDLSQAEKAFGKDWMDQD